MSFRKVVFIFTLICLPYFSIQLSTIDSPTYIAGVVEFKRSNDNLADYLKIIESNEAIETDIIVFPEGTLSKTQSASYVPESNENTIPCGNDNFDEIISSISCAAAKSKKYIIINITEKKNCTKNSQKLIHDSRPCAQNGLNKYNTNVVFDRNGKVISKYRKWNLFGENNTNTTSMPEYAMFETDFGVKFGHFICFDILFNVPAQILISQFNITDIIFPTMWYSELPFLTAVQIQQSWAEANQVNLLAAGDSNPQVGSTGTGIYSGKNGAIVSEMKFGSGETKLYVGTVLKNVRNTNKIISNFKNEEYIISDVHKTPNISLKRDEIDHYKTAIINFTADHHLINKKLCYNDFCCNFHIKTKSQNIVDTEKSYQYRLVAYKGKRSFSGYSEGCFQICAIIACTNDSIVSCARLFSNDVEVKNDFIFDTIEIESDFDFEKNPVMLIMTNSLDMNLRPLSPTNYHVNKIETSISNKKIAENIKLKLTKPRSDLLTFGIYANTFVNSSGIIVSNISLVLITIAVLLGSFMLSNIRITLFLL